jgi:hypothetical protein
LYFLVTKSYPRTYIPRRLRQLFRARVNRYFGKEPEMAVKRQTKVEGNKD